MDFSEIQNLRALVIDDFETVRRSIKGMLNDLGFQKVSEAFDAQSASRLIKQHDFDLILCDFNLGKGRNGLRLLEEWRVEKLIPQSSVFVLITGDTSRQIVVSALEFQPDDYVAKPFTMDVLKVRLNRWFERRKALLPMLVSSDKKDWEGMARVALSMIEKHPRHRSIAQKKYVEAMIQMKRYQQAESFLQGLLDKRYLSWAQSELNRIAIDQGEFTEAEAGLRGVILNDPYLIQAYDYLAESLKYQNKKEDRQFVLDQAIHLAPQNVNRMDTLIEAALDNEDYHRASVALKDLIAMVADSRHESIELYQRYIHNLSLEEEMTDSSARKKEIRKELVNAGKQMKNRYGKDINVQLFSDALAVRTSVEPASLKFTSVLNELYKETLDQLDEINGLTAMMLTSTFYRAERFPDADDMVQKFVKKFDDDRALVKDLKTMQSEPVSLALRKQAHALNMKGIDLYEHDEFGKALDFFNRAMEMSPRHPGIILNFVQSSMQMMKENGYTEAGLNRCQEYLDRLQYLPEDHKQYKRCKTLTKHLVQAMEQ